VRKYFGVRSLGTVRLAAILGVISTGLWLPIAGNAQDRANPGYLGLTADENPDGRGVVVLEVAADSPAKLAALAPGDVLLSINGRILGDLNDLIAEMKGRSSGERLDLKVLRQPRLLNVQLTLGVRPNFKPAPPTVGPINEPLPRNLAMAWLGIQLEDEPGEGRNPGRVRVKQAAVPNGQSPHIPAGSYLREVDKIAVTSVEECELVLIGRQRGDRVEVTYVVGNVLHRTQVTLGIDRLGPPNAGVGPGVGRPGMIESRLGEGGRRPILGRLGRVLDGEIIDGEIIDGEIIDGGIIEGGPLPPGLGNPGLGRFRDIPGDAPRGVDTRRPPGAANGPDLAAEVRELRLLVEALLERMDALEKKDGPQKPARY
jgi:hypothetical protein